MPIFEYRCNTCGHSFEKLVSNAASKVSCERCDSKQIEKQLSTFNVAVGAPPCSGGGCPASGKAATGCSGGGCPFS